MAKDISILVGTIGAGLWGQPRRRAKLWPRRRHLGRHQGLWPESRPNGPCCGLRWHGRGHIPQHEPWQGLRAAGLADELNASLEHRRSAILTRRSSSPAPALRPCSAPPTPDRVGSS